MIASIKARHVCEACGRDRGTVYVFAEDKHICLECAQCWQIVAQERKGLKQDGHQRIEQTVYTIVN